MSRLLVIGVGNEFRGDDGVGPLTARALEGRIGAEVQVILEDGDGTRLIHAWSPGDVVIIVDSFSPAGEPGRVRRLEIGRAAPAVETALYSSHSLGVAEAIELGRSVGKFPSRIILFGIEGSKFSLGSHLTPSVRASMPKLEQMILAEISDVRHSAGSPPQD